MSKKVSGQADSNLQVGFWKGREGRIYFSFFKL